MTPSRAALVVIIVGLIATIISSRWAASPKRPKHAKTQVPELAIRCSLATVGLGCLIAIVALMD